MMNYYLDTEFLEGTQNKRLFGIPYGKTPNTIDLISIGIVSEDNREYYAISKDFNLKEAWNRYDIKKVNDEIKVYWIRENVIKPIFIELWEKSKGAKLTDADFRSGIFNYKHIKQLISKYGKTNKKIAYDIIQFTSPELKRYNKFGKFNYSKPKFYAYYADYDWVVFCWLFGNMVDLPKSFPKYCIDLKQILDEKASRKDLKLAVNNKIPLKGIDQLKNHPNYPKQENEHNALDDAHWNMKLHKFLKTI